MRILVKDITTTGAAGSAAGSTDFQAYPGEQLKAVSLDYITAPATTVISVTNPDVPGNPTVTVPAGNTDRIVRPRLPVQDANSADIMGTAEPVQVQGRVAVAVSNADAASPAVRVRLFMA